MKWISWTRALRLILTIMASTMSAHANARISAQDAAQPIPQVLTSGRPSQTPAATPPTSTVPRALPRIGILTPALPEKILVYAGKMILIDIPGGIADKRNTAQFAKLARDEGYDFGERFIQQAVLALTAAGFDAIAMPITRGPRNEAVTRDELPENIDGRVLIDANFEELGIVSFLRGGSYQPTSKLLYRLVSPAGSLQQSSRAIYYCRPGMLCTTLKKYADLRTEIDTSNCLFETASALSKESSRVWSCMDGMMRKIAEKIARDITAEQPTAK